MKQQVFYIHGGESFIAREDFIERLKIRPIWDLPSNTSKKKWTSTFATDLGEDFEVFMPEMPTKQNARFAEWSIWFERHFEHLSDGVVLIGCSLGAMFLAKYISENDLPFRPKAIILMAGVYQLPNFADKACGDFLVEPGKVRAILEKTDKVVIMHSKDDFLVPFEHAEALSVAIPEAELVVFEDKNHFLVEELPELVELIKGL